MKDIKKQLTVSLIVVLVVNMVLFALGKASQTTFWATIAIIGVFAYFILPRIKSD